MTKLKIYTFPDIVLKQKAEAVEQIDESLRTLARDMLDTMYDAPGIGLAANQVGVLKRIIVVDVDHASDEDDDDDEDITSNTDIKTSSKKGSSGDNNKKEKGPKFNPIVLINPEIISSAGKITFNEGCLSVPEFSADIERKEKIKVNFLDLKGKRKEIEADGLLSVVIQHEMDHLNGKLFIDRLSPAKRSVVKKKLLLQREEREEE